VEVIEPFAGKIYDPACGSGGMFVQSAKFIQEANHDLSDIYVYGQEYMGETARLAKMNLMVNNIRGEITETNSYENDPYTSLGKFDFVMANPPFNVKSVKESTVKNDERFYKYGLPKNKGNNTDDSITDANYLWVSLFATSLNDKGRAGFVMPNSASDAGNSEYEIRKKLVDSNIVDCMVSMPSNMFFTVTLPATLWFLDKQKVNTDRKDKILFLDARNTYTQVDRAHREWKEEQVQNLAAIVRLYRGETDRYLELVESYVQKAQDAICLVETPCMASLQKMQLSLANLKQYLTDSHIKRKPEEKKILDESGLVQKISALVLNDNQALRLRSGAEQNPCSPTEPESSSRTEIKGSLSEVERSLSEVEVNLNQLSFAEQLTYYLSELKALDTALKSDKDAICEIWAEADKILKLKADKTWVELELNNLAKTLDELYQNWKTAIDTVTYWHTNITWLQSRFPDAKYIDVTGLCKVADKQEYAGEQDYSLNSGRYVGVELEELSMPYSEFKSIIFSIDEKLVNLNNKAAMLEKTISENLKNLIK
jgi:type I restriction enzyme M protein